MKGHRSISIFQGYTTGPAKLSNQDGKPVADFIIGVGGYKDYDIPAVFIRCHAWGDKAKPVAKAIKSKGLAVTVAGSLTQSTRKVNGVIYINNELNIWGLLSQSRVSALSLDEIISLKGGFGAFSAN
jgi:hypothetical protein